MQIEQGLRDHGLQGRSAGARESLSALMHRPLPLADAAAEAELDQLERLYTPPTQYRQVG